MAWQIGFTRTSRAALFNNNANHPLQNFLMEDTIPSNCESIDFPRAVGSPRYF